MPVAVAVSGGADSTALLLHASRTFPAEAITALAVDHGTRKAAAAERTHAGALAAWLRIRFETLAVSPKGYGHAHWREARLAALTQYCRRMGIPTLWLGQHGDDAIETAAIRLLAQGPLESLAGIAAVREVDGVRIERPLLRRSARQIRRSLMAAGIGWTEDPSNRSLAYKRAAVRRVRAAMPEACPADAERLHRLAEWRARRDRIAARSWQLVACPSPLGAVAFDAAGLATLPPGLRARLIRHAALMATGAESRLRQADFLEACRLASPVSLGGACLFPHGRQWWVCRTADAIAPSQPLGSGMVWDRRCRITLSMAPPPGDWQIAPVRGRRIGAMARLAPAPVLDALPAVTDRHGRIVSVPHLRICRGREGPYWAGHLHFAWTAPASLPIFELVP